MSSSKGNWFLALFVLAGIVAYLLPRPASAASGCPAIPGATLREADVFDGPPGDEVYLQADHPGKNAGYFDISAIIAEGRFVTLRCRYSNDASIDVKVDGHQTRCDYRYDSKRNLVLNCR